MRTPHIGINIASLWAPNLLVGTYESIKFMETLGITAVQILPTRGVRCQEFSVPAGWIEEPWYREGNAPRTKIDNLLFPSDQKCQRVLDFFADLPSPPRRIGHNFQDDCEVVEVSPILGMYSWEIINTSIRRDIPLVLDSHHLSRSYTERDFAHNPALIGREMTHFEEEGELEKIVNRFFDSNRVFAFHLHLEPGVIDRDIEEYWWIVAGTFYHRGIPVILEMKWTNFGNLSLHRLADKVRQIVKFLHDI